MQYSLEVGLSVAQQAEPGAMVASDVLHQVLDDGRPHVLKTECVKIGQIDLPGGNCFEATWQTMEPDLLQTLTATENFSQLCQCRAGRR